MSYVYQCATKDGKESDYITATSPIDAARKYTGVKTLRKAEIKGNKVFWDVIVHKYESNNRNIALTENLYVYRY
ncbi:MAG: hypothetical protein IJZ36_01520 [Bacilli bacterium]|nr:hypothetical protein [Bacilli bacterium]